MNIHPPALPKVRWQPLTVTFETPEEVAALVGLTGPSTGPRALQQYHKDLKLDDWLESAEVGLEVDLFPLYLAAYTHLNKFHPKDCT